MRENIAIVPVSNRPRWEHEHAQDGLPSQSWAYADALNASGIESQLAVVEAGGARMLLPFFQRRWKGTTDIASTLGLSGLTVNPDSSAPLLLWREYAKSRGWVAGYLQLSPFSEIADTAGETHASNVLFLMNLGVPDFLRHASEIVRRKVTRAERNGTELCEDRAKLADALNELYPATMRRVGAGAHYNFTRESLSRWANDPGCLVLGGRVAGAVQAVSVFGVANRIAEFHLNASSESGRDLSTWLIWQAAQRLSDRNVQWLNLGGGMRRGDGLFSFKARFNGEQRPLRALRQIYDREKYAALCAEAGVSERGEWFPPYRAGKVE